jgi:hypothetical protein
MNMQKTKQELDDLKRSWKYDPCWDIEDTEEFGDYADELKAYRLDEEKKWTEAENLRLFVKSCELNCSVQLVKHIEFLEYKIEKLLEAVPSAGKVAK